MVQRLREYNEYDAQVIALPKIAGISDIVVEEVNYRGKAEKEKRVDDSPPVISEEIMNLTLEELRESIAKQEMELYGRTLSDDKTGYYERCRKAEGNKK